MHLAYPLPWWLALLLAAAIAAAVFVEYRRPLAPLTAIRRGLLAALRALTLAALVAFLFRPIALLPPAAARSCRSSSTRPGACASPTPTARRASPRPPRSSKPG